MSESIKRAIEEEVQRTAGWTPEDRDIEEIVEILNSDSELSVREAVRKWQNS